jgi:hypothetical protein
MNEKKEKLKKQKIITNNQTKNIKKLEYKNENNNTIIIKDDFTLTSNDDENTDLYNWKHIFSSNTHSIVSNTNTFKTFMNSFILKSKNDQNVGLQNNLENVDSFNKVNKYDDGEDEHINDESFIDDNIDLNFLFSFSKNYSSN